MGLILNKSQCACKPLRVARIGIERGMQKTSSLSARSRACCLRFFAHAQQRCSVRVPSAVSPRCIFGRSMTELLGPERGHLHSSAGSRVEPAPEAHVELGGSSAPTRLGKTSRGSTDDKEIQGGRPCKLELGGREGQRENRQGAYKGRELQRIRPPRQQGRTAVRNQKRQDRPCRPA